MDFQQHRVVDLEKRAHMRRYSIGIVDLASPAAVSAEHSQRGSGEPSAGGLWLNRLILYGHVTAEEEANSHLRISIKHQGFSVIPCRSSSSRGLKRTCQSLPATDLSVVSFTSTSPLLPLFTAKYSYLNLILLILGNIGHCLVFYICVISFINQTFVQMTCTLLRKCTFVDRD
jgi:hypothetical protein